MDERTITVEGYFGKPKQMTRNAFVAVWGNQAYELTKIGLNVYDEAKEKAGAEWDRLYAVQNPDAEDEDEDLPPDDQELLNWGETDYDRRNDLR